MHADCYAFHRYICYLILCHHPNVGPIVSFFNINKQIYKIYINICNNEWTDHGYIPSGTVRTPRFRLLDYESLIIYMFVDLFYDLMILFFQC